MMHWGSSLFLLFCVLLFVPLRLQFAVVHQKAWTGTVTIKFLFFHYTKHILEEKKVEKQKPQKREEPVQQALSPDVFSSETPAKTEQNVSDAQQESTEKVKPQKHSWSWKHRKQKQHVQRSFQAHWKSVAAFALRAFEIVVHKLHLEQLSLRCRIGFSQPTWTAYSYGFFWTALSILPLDKIKQVDVEYIPDFQQQRQEINLQGIISCRFGQLIHILFSLLWLVLKMTLEQNRKEQMVYES